MLLGLFSHPRFRLFVVLAAAYRALQNRNKASPTSSVLETYVRTLTAALPVGASSFVADVLGAYAFYETYRFLVKSQRDARMVTKKSIVNFVGGAVVDFAKQVPFLRGKVEEEMSKLRVDLRKQIKGNAPSAPDHVQLPSQGTSHELVLKRMQELCDGDAQKWQNGRVSGGVYHGGDAMLALQAKAYEMFSISNPLHSDLWPSVMRMESEVLSMTANMVNGGDSNVCGVITSGGTESIMLATKMHRDYYRKTRGITRPEIVCAVTAHAAIDKACATMNIRLLKARIDPKTKKADVASMRSLMSESTIMVYSSAPHFPHGIIDDIQALSDLAQEFDCGLHVDACLGGFVLPFLNKLGPEYAVGKFGFECAGVTSMSCDTHKYGYAAKGTSVMLARSAELRHFAYSIHPEWTGGLYVTPTFAGSKAGALSACCWASMVSMGEEGYKASAKLVVDARRKASAAIETMDGLFVLGDPKAMIVAFGSDEFNVYELGDLMTHKREGWSLNLLQSPACIHLCVTLKVAPVIDEFIEDLRDCCRTMMERKMSGKASPTDGAAPIYGMAASAPAGPLGDVLCAYTDIVLST